MKFDAQEAAKHTPATSTTAIGESSSADVEILIRKAHRVLVRYMPGAQLPDELSRVRALLDAHMFGRDGRASRDDVVEVARQIDQVLPPAQT
jgi:hypothetical protein